MLYFKKNNLLLVFLPLFFVVSIYGNENFEYKSIGIRDPMVKPIIEIKPTINSFAESNVKKRTAELNKLIDNSKENTSSVSETKAENKNRDSTSDTSINIQAKLPDTSIKEQERISLNFINGDLQNMLRMIARSANVNLDNRSNTLIVNDIPARISQIKKVVERLDRPTPQVLIEVKYVEIILGDAEREGVDWSTLGDYSVMLNEMLYTFDRQIQESVTRTRSSGTGGGTAQATRDYSKNTDKGTTYQLSPKDFKLTMSLLMNNSKTKIISNPKVQTLDNRKATIKVAETMYKPTFSYNKETGTYEINNLEELYIGVTLEVTPHINYDDFITLDITPEVSSLAGFQVIQGVEIPNTNIRKVEARVSLKDSYTVAIGGMIKDEFIKARKSVPMLGDLPYIGKYLFSWESKELKKVNLVIFITPTIIKPDRRIDRWDKQFKEMQLTPDGEWHDVVSNYPSWHMLAVHEQQLLDAATNFVEEVETESVK